MQTTWVHRFFDDFDARPGTGAWYERRANWLLRESDDLGRLRVVDTADGPLTVVTVEGDNDIDVHLALGDKSRSAADVLAGAVPFVGTDRSEGVAGNDLVGVRPGPGVTVGTMTAYSPGDRLGLRLPRFTVRAEHDLMEHADVFGIEAVRAPETLFPGIGPVPLPITDGTQSAFAEFTAKGFRAAAVTSLSSVRSAPGHRVKLLAVCFDRPFAFYAVHRPTGLILVAGWVAEPEWGD